MNVLSEAARMTEAPRPRRIGASVGAVAAGFVTTFALSTGIDAVLHATGVYPAYGARMSDGLFWLALAYRGLATIVGGWVTARLAPSGAMKHALILGVIGTLAGVGGIAVALNHRELGPLWYPVLLVVTAWPCIWIGARWRVRQAAAPGL